MAEEILFFKEITAESIAELIEKCKDKKEIKLLLHSYGGNPTAARAFYNFIKRHSINLHVEVIGTCVSSALILLCAGCKRTAARNATLMLHRVRRTFQNDRLTTDQIGREMTDLEEEEKSFQEIIRQTCSREDAISPQMFSDEVRLTYEQAHELGLLNY